MTIHFNIRIIAKGDKYGLNNVMTHEDKHDMGPMVEFYDPRFQHTPNGQFVSRYYVSTILAVDHGGLCLDGSVPAWNVNAAQMDEVRATLRQICDR